MIHQSLIAKQNCWKIQLVYIYRLCYIFSTDLSFEKYIKFKFKTALYIKAQNKH